LGEIAFVFPGQGAQSTGMGRELVDCFPKAASVFRSLDAIRPGTSRQSFEGTEDELAQTANTQPCLFAVEMAAAAALEEAGVRASRTAGFSLGEIAALTYAGAFTLEDGFRLVCRRGLLMQESAQKQDAAMVAVIKLSASEVERLAAKYEHVYPVNYNSPGQTSVAGVKEQLERFSQDVKEAGGRAIPLKVKGGFHSPFMEEASHAFAASMTDIPWNPMRIPLYSNVTGKPYEGDMADLLSRQIRNPVRWQATIEHMIADGVDTFIEVGPGKTLSGFIQRIDASVRIFHVEDAASLRETAEGVGAC